MIKFFRTFWLNVGYRGINLFDEGIPALLFDDKFAEVILIGICGMPLIREEELEKVFLGLIWGS